MGKVSRRKVLKWATAAAAGPFIKFAWAQKGPTLRILQWSHFVPAYDKWFDAYAKAWGEKNGVNVVSDHINYADIPARAAAEVAAKSGHDLFAFGFPPAQYEPEVVPLNDVVSELRRRFGPPYRFVERSCYNPRTRTWFALMDFWAVDPILYRKDLFDEVGGSPDTWEGILEAGRKLKAKGFPIGIGFSPEIDTAMAMRTIMWGFGASIQNEAGQIVLNSKETLEALKFARALFQEAETPEVLAWDASSNNRLLVSGRGALILNAVSALRTAEDTYPDLAKKIFVAKTAAGPVARRGSAHWYNSFVIWKFSPNVELAKKFLLDLMANYREAFLASRYYNVPSFEGAVKDWKQLVQDDPKADPRNKYAILATAPEWTVNVGYPGYLNAAEAEIFDRWIINDMFTMVATDKMKPEEALKAAEAQVRQVFAKWRERKLV